MSDSFTISIGTEHPEDPVNAFEFSYFLMNFRAIYVLALELGPDETNVESLADEVRRLSYGLSGLSISRIAKKRLPLELDLEFESITKNSPLRLRTCMGVSMVALSVAVILSGGKVNLKEGIFEVPSLASGIRELKNVLGQKIPTHLPSDKRHPTKPKTHSKNNAG